MGQIGRKRRRASRSRPRPHRQEGYLAGGQSMCRPRIARCAAARDSSRAAGCTVRLSHRRVGGRLIHAAPRCVRAPVEARGKLRIGMRAESVVAFRRGTYRDHAGFVGAIRQAGGADWGTRTVVLQCYPHEARRGASRCERRGRARARREASASDAAQANPPRDGAIAKRGTVRVGAGRHPTSLSGRVGF